MSVDHHKDVPKVNLPGERQRTGKDKWGTSSQGCIKKSVWCYWLEFGARARVWSWNLSVASAELYFILQAGGWQINFTLHAKSELATGTPDKKGTHGVTVLNGKRMWDWMAVLLWGIEGVWCWSIKIYFRQQEIWNEHEIKPQYLSGFFLLLLSVSIHRLLWKKETTDAFLRHKLPYLNHGTPSLWLQVDWISVSPWLRGSLL